MTTFVLVLWPLNADRAAWEQPATDALREHPDFCEALPSDVARAALDATGRWLVWGGWYDYLDPEETVEQLEEFARSMVPEGQRGLLMLAYEEDEQTVVHAVGREPTAVDALPWNLDLPCAMQPEPALDSKLKWAWMSVFTTRPADFAEPDDTTCREDAANRFVEAYGAGRTAHTWFYDDRVSPIDFLIGLATRYGVGHPHRVVLVGEGPDGIGVISHDMRQGRRSLAHAVLALPTGVEPAERSLGTTMRGCLLSWSGR